MAFSREPKRSMIIGPGVPIVIDSVNSEDHLSVVNYTRYPIESGRLGSDHAQEQPEELEINILVTDTPLQKDALVFEGRHRAIYSQLRFWQKLKSPLIVVLGLRSYVNMHIERLNPVKAPNDGKSIKINIKFVEVQIVELGLTSLAAGLLVDSSIVHTATDLVPIGVI